MNPTCPQCGYDWRSDGLPEGGTVPYEENDKMFTLQFCSTECRDKYIGNEVESVEKVQ